MGILKQFIRVTVFITVVIPITAIAKIKCEQFYNRRPQVFSSAELDQRLYAIHLTDYVPSNSLLRIRTGDRARFSATLHFSLGSPVTSHSAGNWESKKYAVLLPLKYLKARLVNLLAQDTFIVGDLELPKDSILLVPIGEAAPSDFNGRIIFYDLNVGIAEQVRTELEKLNSIVLKQTGPFLSDKIFFGEKVINQEEFFQDYFKENPYLSHQIHSETVYGKLDIGIHSFFANWYYRNKPSTWSLAEMKSLRIEFESLLEDISHKVNQMGLIGQANASYLKSLDHLRALFNVIDAEILMQVRYHKSFMSAGEPFKSEVLKRMWDKEELGKYLEKSRNDFVDKP